MSSGSARIAPHTCVAHESGSYSCWGGNGVGQLGVGALSDRLGPAAVSAPAKVPEERIPADATDLLRTWVDEAVQQREREHPWLRAAWDHIRDRTSAAQLENIQGIVRPVCDGIGESYECRAESMEIAEMNLGIVVHELAHVYDGTTGLAPRRAWGAVQLYFGATYPECFRDQGQWPGSEILANTLAHLVAPGASLVYYETGCPGLGDEPDREAEEVLLAGLAGRVPDWYTASITDGTDLWTVLRRVLALPLLGISRESSAGSAPPTGSATRWTGP